MILLKEILRKLILRESWETTIKHKNDIVEIFKNPSTYELKNDIYKKDYEVRALIDMNTKNIYAWDGFHDHSDIAPKLSQLKNKNIIPIYILYENGQWKITIGKWSIKAVSSLSQEQIEDICNQGILNDFDNIKKITNIPIVYA